MIVLISQPADKRSLCGTSSHVESSIGIYSGRCAADTAPPKLLHLNDVTTLPIRGNNQYVCMVVVVCQWQLQSMATSQALREAGPSGYTFWSPCALASSAGNQVKDDDTMTSYYSASCVVFTVLQPAWSLEVASRNPSLSYRGTPVRSVSQCNTLQLKPTLQL